MIAKRKKILKKLLITLLLSTPIYARDELELPHTIYPAVAEDLELIRVNYDAFDVTRTGQPPHPTSERYG